MGQPLVHIILLRMARKAKVLFIIIMTTMVLFLEQNGIKDKKVANLISLIMDYIPDQAALLKMVEREALIMILVSNLWIGLMLLQKDTIWIMRQQHPLEKDMLVF